MGGLCLFVGGGGWAECTLQMAKWSREMQRVVLSENGNPESVHLPGPALALFSGPLWTIHNHFDSRKNPQNVRVAGGILFEFSSYTVSCGLRTSRLVMASLFLEKTFFKPLWEYALHPLAHSSLHLLFWCKCDMGGVGTLGLFLAHHLSWRGSGKDDDGTWRPP